MNDTPRRAVILTAASRVIAHYGPFKSTVADIAREARVGVGTVYLEFKSKDAILEELSRSRHERVLTAIEVAWGSGRPAKKRLALALSARIEAFLGSGTEGAHGADLFACSCPAIEHAHRAFAKAEHALFSRFLREATERGELAVGEPDQTARALLLAYRAFQPPDLFAHPRDALERDLARLHRLVLEGLLPRGRAR
jgi:AcrR family transcriptional regulator